MGLTKSQEKALVYVAKKIGVPRKKLWGLIQFESSWNPRAKNKYSSARGLIQFVNKTARDMGYASSLDLVNKNPTIEDQLYNPILKYFQQYIPYVNDQSLFMAVFYPAARFWPELKEFPGWVKDVNPGIKTPLDYMAFVYKRLNWQYIPRFIILGVAILSTFYLYNTKNQKPKTGDYNDD